MRKIVIIFLFSLFAIASEIEIDAKIFPAIVKYDLKVNKKLVEKQIKISILYQNSFKKRAKKLKKLIQQKYSVLIELIPQHLILQNLKNTTAIYIFNLDKTYLKYVVNFAKKRNLITFSDSPSLLQYGVTVSILNKRRVRPILNRKIIKESNISFSSTLLKVSFIYEE